ncbi:hypothetical protein TNCV_4513441 [Trichonephila clavipes]|nr:hypothetical protein TNCV_4513441 [Trichonephila clavipes]
MEIWIATGTPFGGCSKIVSRTDVFHITRRCREQEITWDKFLNELARRLSIQLKKSLLEYLQLSITYMTCQESPRT